jgi:hypothetical protein
MSDISAFGVGQLYEDKLQTLTFFRIDKLENICYVEERNATRERKFQLIYSF